MYLNLWVSCCAVGNSPSLQNLNNTSLQCNFLNMCVCPISISIPCFFQENLSAAASTKICNIACAMSVLQNLNTAQWAVSQQCSVNVRQMCITMKFIKQFLMYFPMSNVIKICSAGMYIKHIDLRQTNYMFIWFTNCKPHDTLGDLKIFVWWSKT